MLAGRRRPRGPHRKEFMGEGSEQTAGLREMEAPEREGTVGLLPNSCEPPGRRNCTPAKRSKPERMEDDE